jgi:hypothetical protein
LNEKEKRKSHLFPSLLREKNDQTIYSANGVDLTSSLIYMQL